MPYGYSVRRWLGVLAVLLLAGLPGVAQQMPREYRNVLTILGRTGDYQNQVLQLRLPRTAPRFTMLGWTVPAAFGFTGKVSMTRGARGQQVMMGELVLLQQEVNAIVSILLDQHIAVTAVHNHFLWDTPRAMFVHFTATGAADDLARRVKPALDFIGNVVPPDGEADERNTQSTGATPPALSLNRDRLNRIVRHQGQEQGAAYRYMIDRNDIRLVVQGARITGRMGLDIETQFIGSDQNAAIVCEMALLPSEVTPVTQALRTDGIWVTALHHHMIGTAPEIIYLHFEARGTAQQLAYAFRDALNAARIK